MNLKLTDPTNLPGGDRRPVPVNLPTPASELFASEDGKRWKLAGTDRDGGRLFVPEHLDPAQVKRWLWAEEAYLVEAVGALTPVAVPMPVGMPTSVEDPHDSPLHHTYATPRDLPEVTP
ncbi:hypothetical protein ABZS95_10405 [Streptomyces sp. NPDC005479]|uniref:hypothetical protein n=1 Tax=Streptomyces sp. NPDC005479 TaxID=3154879 RepID=UPI0033ADCF8B